jgi:hypothetical protein
MNTNININGTEQNIDISEEYILVIEKVKDALAKGDFDGWRKLKCKANILCFDFFLVKNHEIERSREDFILSMNQKYENNPCYSEFLDDISRLKK